MFADTHTYIIKIKVHSSCEIEDFFETHLCKLCVILRSRVLHILDDITTYVIATKHGRRVCAGRAKHVVDLDLAVARTGPHEVGAGRATDPPGGPEVGEHAPEEVATRYSSCDEWCELKR